LVAVYAVIAFIRFAVARNKSAGGKEVSLCLACINSVVTRGTLNEEWIACNYGGAMRAVKFTVCSCSGYRTPVSTKKLVTIEGFVREEREVYPEVAIS
jgi:hypothetical protein